MKSMKMIKKAQAGFTLIELMIVVAIIGILAAVAIPQYQDYVTRAKLAKVNTAVDSVKLAMAEAIQLNNGTAPAGANQWASLGLDAAGPTATTEVSAVTTNGAAITATMRAIGSPYDGVGVVYTAQPGETAVTWTISCSASLSNAKATTIMNKVFGPTTGC